MSKESILIICEIAAMIASVVLFFLGLYLPVRAMRKGGNDRAAQLSSFNAVYMKSIVFLVCGVVASGLSKTFKNYTLMSSDGYELLGIFLQSLWEAVLSYGFLIIIPIIIKRWRFTASLPKGSEDD